MTYEGALAALADPTRRKILERLNDMPSSVGDLANGLPVSRPAVSQHLCVLKAAQLVGERRDGIRRIYSVRTDGLADLKGYLERFWEDALASFKEIAESETGGNDDRKTE